MSSQRLQKILAQAGVASRRAAEALIEAGRVRVNGRIIRELGTRADPGKDRVEVDGKRLVAERPVYYLMHKPRGVVTTLDDPEGRKSVKDLLRGIPQRLFPVGRLDFNTSGALLLTNDGDLAQALLHPTRAVPKTYNVKLQGKLDEQRLTALREGVVLDDGTKTAPAEVTILRRDDKHTQVEITIAEGKNRQIHRMGEAILQPVMRLTRISFAGLTLEHLHPGQMRELTPKELGELKQKYLHAQPRRRGRFDASVAAGDPEDAVEVTGEARRDVRRQSVRGGRERTSPRVDRKQGAARSTAPRRTTRAGRKGPQAPRPDVGTRRDAQQGRATRGRTFRDAPAAPKKPRKYAASDVQKRGSREESRSRPRKTVRRGR